MRTVIGAGGISSLLPGRRHPPASLHDAAELLPATAGPRSPRRPGPAGRSRTPGTGNPPGGRGIRRGSSAGAGSARSGWCPRHAQLGCGRINERSETRMILAATVWQHQPEKTFDDILGSYSLGGNIHFLRLSPHFRWQGTVNRLSRKLVKVGGKHVHKPMAQVAEDHVVHRERRGNSAIPP